MLIIIMFQIPRSSLPSLLYPVQRVCLLSELKEETLFLVFSLYWADSGVKVWKYVRVNFVSYFA